MARRNWLSLGTEGGRKSSERAAPAPHVPQVRTRNGQPVGVRRWIAAADGVDCFVAYMGAGWVVLAKTDDSVRADGRSLLRPSYINDDCVSAPA